MEKQAFERFQLENNVKEVDGIYLHDVEAQNKILSERPWTKDTNYFKRVHISCTALIKMVMHSKSGGDIEVMGMMQGRIVGDTMVVIDAFALPVEGTETRVNAAVEGYEYMVQYMEQTQRVGRTENVLGWYHSHPGYGCWLSGIDVNTQMLNQQYQEPFVALVIDPIRTIASGKVEIGAFRTYPKDHISADSAIQTQNVPLEKVQDFGVHCKQYYPLEVTYFKSSLDTRLLEELWKTYWISTLTSSDLISSWGYLGRQIDDLGQKMDSVDQRVPSSLEKIAQQRYTIF